jgi:peptidoglycan/xylan/chitin deacetylase (PgdA/CDA1 family)
VTFDDAYANFFDRAWPVLEALALPVTLFVPVGFVERTHPAPIRGIRELPPATWPDLSAAAAGGLVAIGAHSWSHRDLRQVPESDLDLELAGARQHLGERLQVPVDSFCYPRALWNRRIERHVAVHYGMAVIGGGRRWAPPQSPWRVQRVSLRRDGPPSLEPILAAPVWLEEWAADRARRLRYAGRSDR